MLAETASDQPAAQCLREEQEQLLTHPGARLPGFHPEPHLEHCGKLGPLGTLLMSTLH